MSTPLFFQQRFFPYFCCQFFGAFNDSLFKNALIIIIVFQIAHQHAGLLVNAAAVSFILPFLLFGALAGQVADKYEKAKLIRIIKQAEVLIMLVGCAALYSQNVYFMLFVLFCLGTQSAFFGPIKYSILPQYLTENEVVSGNGYVEAGTFLAILIGTLLGGLLAEKVEYLLILMIVSVSLALIGWLFSTRIPSAPAADGELKINFNALQSSFDIIKSTRQQPNIFITIVAISWFWFVGSVLLTQFPLFTKDAIFANERVANLLLAVFSIGVAIGSILCAKLSRGRAEIGFVSLGAFGMSYFIWALSHTQFAPLDQMRDLTALFNTQGSWMMLFNMFMIAFSAGVYVVPLFTFIQIRCDKRLLSRVFAVNNIMNSLFMVVAGVSCAILLSKNMSVGFIFKATAIASFVVTIYIVYRFPEFLLRLLSCVLVHTLYRFKQHNMQHIPQNGAALLVCNHVSYFDPVLIVATSPRPIRFVMYHTFHDLPVAKILFKAMKTIPIAPASENPQVLEQAYQEIAKALQQGELVCIFPEGGITRDGDLQEFQPGVEKILRKTPVPVIPLALKGVWGTWSSFAGGKAIFKFPVAFRKKLSIVADESVPAEQASRIHLFGVVQKLLQNEKRDI